MGLLRLIGLPATVFITALVPRRIGEVAIGAGELPLKLGRPRAGHFGQGPAMRSRLAPVRAVVGAAALEALQAQV